jgi:hypothetical protein
MTDEEVIAFYTLIDCASSMFFDSKYQTASWSYVTLLLVVFGSMLAKTSVLYQKCKDGSYCRDNNYGIQRSQLMVFVALICCQVILLGSKISPIECLSNMLVGAQDSRPVFACEVASDDSDSAVATSVVRSTAAPIASFAMTCICLYASFTAGLACANPSPEAGEQSDDEDWELDAAR